MRPVFPLRRTTLVLLAILTCSSLAVSAWLAAAVSAAPDHSNPSAPLAQGYPPPLTATPTPGASRTPRPIPVLPSPTATPATPMPPAAAPANDTCAAAQVWPSTGPWPMTITQDTRGATMDPNEPIACGGDTNSHSVWFRVVAPVTGWFLLDTCGSDYDTVLTVWEGECAAVEQTALRCNDDECGLQSSLYLSASAGQTYLIRVSSYGTRPGGALNLTVDFRMQPTLTVTPTDTLVPPTSTPSPGPPTWTPYPTPTFPPTATLFAPEPTRTTPQPITLVPPPTVVGTPTPPCAPQPYPGPGCPTPTALPLPYTGAVSIYRLPGFQGSPNAITTGPDGAIWFVDPANSKIGRISVSPVEITMFPLPSTDRQLSDIAAGPDGAVWFTERNGDTYQGSVTGGIGRITSTGQVTEYALNATGILPTFITAGPDGALWFTGYTPGYYEGRLARLTPDGVLTEYDMRQWTTGGPLGKIIAGPDGALWFAAGSDNVGRLTPDGRVTFFPLPSRYVSVNDLVVGPDGAIWTAGRNAVMRLGPDGAFRIVYVAQWEFFSAITVGPDGALWLTTNSSQIDRLTTDGRLSVYAMPSAAWEYRPYDITTGPDGALWFTLPGINAVGRLDPNAPVITQTPTPTAVQTLALPTLPPGPSFTPTPVCGSQPYPGPGCPQPTALPVRYGAATVYSLPSNGARLDWLDRIVVGPDGALWFTEFDADKIGRITTTGQITEYALPSGGGGPRGITVGPDGALWFVEERGGRVGRITTDGLFFTQTLPRVDAYPRHIVTGPDGALWVAGAGPWLTRVVPNGAVTEYRLPEPVNAVEDLTIGPDGALWFAAGDNTIGRFAPDQGVTLFSAPSGYSSPRRLVKGPDAALWYVGRHAGRLSPDGVFREFALGPAAARFGLGRAILRGPDNALWIAYSSTNHLFRLTTDGALTEYNVAGLPDPFDANITDLALGPDGAIWMTLTNRQIARFDPTGPALPTPTATSLLPTPATTLLPTPYPFPTGPRTPYPPPLGTPTVTLTPTPRPYPYPFRTPTVTSTPYAGQPTLVTPPPLTLVPPPTVVGTPTPRCAPNPYPAPDCPTVTPLAPPYTGGISIYRLPSFDGSPRSITLGPDGAVWFTEFNTGKIGRVTLAPVEITLFPLPATDRQPYAITAGPDGAVWFTEQSGGIGRITPSGAVTEYALTHARLMPRYITTGPDGALWFTAYEQFTNAAHIVRLTPDGALTDYTLPGEYDFFYAAQIVAGPDGALWFNNGHRGVGRLTPDGALTLFPSPFPREIILDLVVGPDGAIWTAGDSIMRLGPDGAYRVVYSFPGWDAATAITVGPDGVVWFATRNGQIGRLTLDGHAQLYTVPDDQARYGAGDIVAGPDGALWFTLPWSNAVGRLDPAAPRITQTPTPTAVFTLAPPTLAPGPSFTPTPVCGAQPYPGPGCPQPTPRPIRYGGVTLYTAPAGGVFEASLDQIVVGPDGALWFTEFGADKIGRITPAGEVTEYALPSGGGGPRGITVGPDGALWFVEERGNRVGRITTSGELFTQTLPRPNAYPRHIVTGPDGALWVAGDGPWLTRVVPNGPVTEYRLPELVNSVEDLIVGPDGALWFAGGYNVIGRFAPDQGVTLFRTPSAYSFPVSLTTGPDGALWFVGRHAGRLGLDGVFQEFRFMAETTGGGGRSIIRGPDGALWFADPSSYRLYRLTTDGALTEYRLAGVPNQGYGAVNDLALGPDGAIWMTLAGNRIARFDPAAPALPTPTPTLTPTPYPAPRTATLPAPGPSATPRPYPVKR